MLGMLIIYIAVVVLNAILICVMVLDTTDTFHKRYPDLKIPVRSRYSELSAGIRLGIYALIPIMNAVLLYSLVVDYKNLVENTVWDAYLECMKEKKQDDSKTCNVSGSTEA
jgi:hypothetical protein